MREGKMNQKKNKNLLFRSENFSTIFENLINVIKICRIANDRKIEQRSMKSKNILQGHGSLFLCEKEKISWVFFFLFYDSVFSLLQQLQQFLKKKFQKYQYLREFFHHCWHNLQDDQ